ncbi:MAG: UsfY protein [Mycobacteriaceae bacterium]|nr:UsfY protein [Mycobacteriaceae bacterium]MBV9638460.1 UsfY protein [Mycobacteriaceae bacterium]
MGDTHHDPVDHSRTHHQHAGESMIDTYLWPGFFLLAVGLIALIACVAVAAYKHHEWIMATGVVALASMAAGSAWIAMEHRRVRHIEARWMADHPAGHSHRPAA